MYAIENSNYCNLKYAIQFLWTCFWKIRKIHTSNWIYYSFYEYQIFKIGRILVGQAVFANTVLVLPLCLIEYVREDLLSNFLTEPVEHLKIWERGQQVKQGLLMEQYVLLIWPKFGGGLGESCPRHLFFPGSAGPTSYIDRFNSRSFLIEDDYYTAYHNLSYPLFFILCKGII